MKRLNIVKIILLSVNLLLLLGIFIVLVKNNSVTFISHREKLIFEKELDDKITNISFNITSFNIKLNYSERDKIEIKAYSANDDQLTLTIDNDLLKIASNEKNCIGFCFNNSEKYIEVILPRDIDYQLSINGISSDIFSSVSLKNANIKTKSGDIDLKEVYDVSIDTISGDIVLGNVEEKINIKTVSGDIAIKNLVLEKESTVETTSGDVLINKISSLMKLDTSTVSGSTDIKYDDKDDSQIKLQIKTVSGDIMVN